MTGPREIKRLDFVGSSREDLREFPDEVREDIGYALFEVQRGGKPISAKPLKGFGSKHGIKTPRQDIDLIERRLRAAEEDYRINYE